MAFTVELATQKFYSRRDRTSITAEPHIFNGANFFNVLSVWGPNEVQRNDNPWGRGSYKTQHYFVIIKTYPEALKGSSNLF